MQADDVESIVLLIKTLASGGFGFADPTLLADAACVASWVAAAPRLVTIIGLERIGMHPVPLKQRSKRIVKLVCWC